MTTTDVTDNKNLVEAFYEDFYNRKDFVAARPRLTDGFINHHPGVPPGRDNTIATFRTEVADRMPGFRLAIQRITADGDVVWVLSTVHDGEGPPLGATVDIWRIEDGRLAEHWDFHGPTH